VDKRLTVQWNLDSLRTRWDGESSICGFYVKLDVSKLPRSNLRTSDSMKTALALIAAVFLSACAMAPSFEPTTLEGARCKQRCAENMQLCFGSSYTCDRSYAKCIEACIDTERMAKQGDEARK